MHPEDRAGIYLSKAFFTTWSRSGSAALQTKAPPKAGFAAPWRCSMISGEELVV